MESHFAVCTGGVWWVEEGVREGNDIGSAVTVGQLQGLQAGFWPRHGMDLVHAHSQTYSVLRLF